MYINIESTETNIELSADDRMAILEAKDGAKQLVEARTISLCASFSDDSECRNRENRLAASIEAQAYQKLAKVSFELANAYVLAERNSIKDDSQLRCSIFINPEELAAVANAKKQ